MACVGSQARDRIRAAPEAYATATATLGLSLIWVALIIFTVDAVRASRSYRASALSDPETGMIPLVQAEDVQSK